MHSNCLFCRMVAEGEHAAWLHEDEHCVVLADKYPKAAHHYLVLPKKHIENLLTLSTEEGPVMQHLMLVMPHLAQILGLTKGFRTIINSGVEGGQEIFHLHCHLLANPGHALPGF